MAQSSAMAGKMQDGCVLLFMQHSEISGVMSKMNAT